MSDEAWLSDYLLGEGSAEDRAAAERRLEADPLLAERARELRRVTELLGAVPDEGWHGLDDAPADDAPGPTPPPSLFAGSSAATSAARRQRRRRSLIAVAAAVALFAAGLATGVTVWTQSGSSAHTSAEVTLRPPAGVAAGSARGHATVTADGRMRLTVAGLPAAGRGHFYEAWLMTSTTRLVPLASFRVTGGRAAVQVTLPARLAAYRYIDVSLQNESAGTAISARSVLRGRTTP